MISVALLSLLTAFSGAIVPGTLFAFTVNQSLLVKGMAGGMVGVWLITGHALVELALLLALRLGLGSFLQRKRVIGAIAMVGGLVLLYFAWDMVRLALVGQIATGQARHAAALSPGMLVVQGALLSVLNPYWHLWWATVGVGLITTQAQRHGARTWPVFYVGHITADFIWYVALALLVAISGQMLDPSLHRGLILACGIMLGVLGILFIARPLMPALRAHLAAGT